MAADYYQTIAAGAEAALKIKGSRFLAYAAPAADKEAAEAFLAGLRKRWFDATHHCYAWSLGSGAVQISRSSDDGEPAGTAGKPILAVLQGRELTQLTVVVVRYFGGTKLGTGGLVRAYSASATLVLDQCRVVKIWQTRSLDLRFGYDQLSTILKLGERHDAAIAESEYGERVWLRLVLRQGEAAAFTHAAIEMTHGQIQIEEAG